MRSRLDKISKVPLIDRCRCQNGEDAFFAYRPDQKKPRVVFDDELSQLAATAHRNKLMSEADRRGEHR